MGIRLMENFKNPYISSSFREFWTRWHISLSTWFRDYVYIPLGGNRSGISRWILNILIVFFLSGFWHGAGWNFVIWGLLHGLLLIIETLLQKKLNFRLPDPIKIILVFSCVSIAWIFFRVEHVEDGFTAISHLLTISTDDTLPKIFNINELIFSFLLIVLLLLIETFVKRSFFKNRSGILFLTMTLLFLCYLFGEFHAKEFIYFQF